MICYYFKYDFSINIKICVCNMIMIKVDKIH